MSPLFGNIDVQIRNMHLNYQKKGALKAFVRSFGRAHNDFIPFQLTTFDAKLRN